MSTTVETEMGPLHISPEEIACELRFPWTTRNLVIVAFVGAVGIFDLYSGRGSWWIYLIGLVVVFGMNYARTRTMQQMGTILRSEVTEVRPYRRARYMIIQFIRDGKSRQFFYIMKTKKQRDAAVAAFHGLGYPGPE